MKRVGILTLYYKNYNYGGQLQAYALQKCISTLGYDCKQISFQRNKKDVFFRKIRAIVRESPIEKKKFIMDRMNLIKNKFQHNSIDVNTFKKFDDWIDMIPHTAVFNSRNIELSNEMFDTFIVGSDQVWNTEFVPLNFFLNFVNNGKKKISYAASIRLNKYEKKEGKDIKSLLNTFDYISVRENHAKKILHDIGVKKSIQVDIDPTLLLSVDKWDEVAIEPVVNEQYIFTYLVRDPYALSQIKQFAIINELKIICVNMPGYIKEQEDIFLSIDSGIGPAEFVGLIKNAKYVFVESFHGTVFSILYNKQFIVYGELSNDDRKKTLLEKTGLVDQCIDHKTSYKDFRFNCIDYDFNSILNNYRKESLNRLKTSLE